MAPRTVIALIPMVFAAMVATGGPVDSVAETPVASPRASPGACPVTQPIGNEPPEFGRTEPPQARTTGRQGGYGNAALWTDLWMWGEGQVVVPSSHVRPDGSFGEMKWAWYRHSPGRLTIEGRRLDAPAPPLQAWIPDGYGDLGFQVAGIIFPTEGCWAITGRVGDASLTFVTVVIPPPSPAAPMATPRSEPG